MDRLQDHLYALVSALPCSHANSLFDLCGLSTGSSSSAGNVGGEIKLNGRSVQIIKLLGEGGFSFVYLARDKNSGREFALKKIRCSHGSESFTAAMKEIEAMRRFRSPNIIRILDSAVVQEEDHSSGFGNIPSSDGGPVGPGGDHGGKTVYLFLPYYPLGNVQDAINRHVVHGTRYSESEMLTLFLGTCRAVQAMHRYRLPDVPLGGRPDGDDDDDVAGQTRGGQPTRSEQMSAKRKGAGGGGNGAYHDQAPLIDGAAANGSSDPFGIESDLDSDMDGDADGDAPAYPPKPSASSIAKGKGREVVVEQPSLGGEGTEAGKGGELVPYAHRDIKPGNIMVAHHSSSSGAPQTIPVLMDFGSATKARIQVTSRRAAVAEQDIAAERSTLPYRAPELFDVKTDSELTEGVDVWSLGCTLYAMAYHYSPFETPSMLEQGASTALAVLNGRWAFPREDGENQIYSQGFKEIVQRCLVGQPEKRAEIEEVIELTERALARLG